MARKKKYENALIVQDALVSLSSHIGDIEGYVTLKYLDLKKKKDRELLRNNINGMIELFNDALKELEEK